MSNQVQSLSGVLGIKNSTVSVILSEFIATKIPQITANLLKLEPNYSIETFKEMFSSAIIEELTKIYDKLNIQVSETTVQNWKIYIKKHILADT